MTHIINGMAGNLESHSTLTASESILNITAVLDQEHYGFSKLTVVNATALKWSFVRGDDGSSGDNLTLLKSNKAGSCSSTAPSPTSSGTSSPSGTAISVTTEVVTEYTTFCPSATVFTQGSQTYTVTKVSLLSRVLAVPLGRGLIKILGYHTNDHQLPVYSHSHTCRHQPSVSPYPVLDLYLPLF